MEDLREQQLPRRRPGAVGQQLREQQLWELSAVTSVQLTLPGPFLCSPIAPLLPSHLPTHPSLSIQPILSQINLKSLYLKQDLACCLVSWVGAHTSRHRSLPVSTGHRGARPGCGAAKVLGAPAGSCTRCAWTARSDMPQLVILS